MAFSLDLGIDRDHPGPLFPLGLFSPTTMDFGAHLHQQSPTGISWDGFWFLLELAPDYGADRHHLWLVHALGLLPVETLANELSILRRRGISGLTAGVL